MWKNLLFGVNRRVSGDIGLLLLRIFAGLAMAFAHGWNKIPPSDRFVSGVAEMGFPAPEVFAWAAGISELVGGIFIAFGFLTRPSALFLAITMFVAAFIRHGGDAFGDREGALLYAAISVFLLLQGPGKYAVDEWLHRRMSRA